MKLEIIAAESLGVRGLCCVVTFERRRIVIDPGVALGYVRHGLLPHPQQVAAGRRVRRAIIAGLRGATDVVFSHLHGDHVPLADANPYQLALRSLPPPGPTVHGWTLSEDNLSPPMAARLEDLRRWFGPRLQVAEGETHGPLSFSPAVPHGLPDSPLGEVMMTRVEFANQVFVHASDIQLLDETAVTAIVDWHPDIVLAAGPPLYLQRLDREARQTAWENACRLAGSVGTLILDHHLMRSKDGPRWLDELSAAVGRRVLCAADHMGQPRQLLEARRSQLYENSPVPEGWHERYAKGVDLTGCGTP